MAKNFAEIMIKLGLDKKDLDKGVKETKSSMKDMGKEFLTATAAIAGAGVAIYATGKQIYEVGKRGAMVTQTADSFEYLSRKLALPTDLLEKLRHESRGTITDFKLMSSTATLLAGTSDKLGRALGSATPELMRIAKAANKLNPSLGTTSHMYESIALGIKRASPMILDNLGLTIKIGDANEKMAESLGKSVDQLTAEEKQMALLNATLEAGDKLIQQVGGSVDAATDSYAQMETQIANLTDEFSELINRGVNPLVSELTKVVSAVNDNIDVWGQIEGALRSNIITQEEYNAWIIDYLFHGAKQSDLLEMIEERMWRTGDATEQQETRFQHLVSTMGEAEGATERLVQAYEETLHYQIETAMAAGEQKAALDQARAAADLLSISMGSYSDALIFNKTAHLLDAETALGLAYQLGLVDDRAYYAGLQIAELTDKYDKNNDGIIDNIENTALLRGEILEATEAAKTYEGDYHATLHLRVNVGMTKPNIPLPALPADIPYTQEPGGSTGGGGDYGEFDYRQHGGPVSMGAPYIVGERGPELFVPGRSGTIVPDIGRNMMSGVRGGIRGGYDETALDTMRAMDGLVKSAEKALGISSPSTEMYDVGLDMMEGLEIGIQIGGRGVSRAARDVMEGLDYEVTRGMADFRDEVDRGMEEARSRAARGMDDFRDEVEEGMEGARSRADDGMKDLHEEVDKWLGEIGRHLVESGEDWKKYYEIIGMPPNMPWPTFIPPEPEEPSGPSGHPIPDPSLPDYGDPPGTMPPTNPDLATPPSRVGTGISGDGTGTGDPGRIGGTAPEVLYMRGGDTVIVQSPAYAAFLVEQQHQAEFEEIGRVI